MKKTYFINIVRMLYLCIGHLWKDHRNKIGKSGHDHQGVE